MVMAGFSFLSAVVRSRTFLMLLALDLVLIALHLLTMSFLECGGTLLWGSFRSDSWLRLDRDRNPSEWYEAAKMIGGAALLIHMARGGAGRSLYAFAFIALYMTADNLLRIHERVGIHFGVSGVERHIAVFVYMAAVGGVILAVIVACSRRASQVLRPAVVGLGLAILMVGVAAAVLDIAHQLFGARGSAPNMPLTVLEDGGELIAQSLFLACAVFLLRLKLPDKLTGKAVLA